MSREELEQERARRAAWEERRRRNLSPAERLQEETWTKLYGDRRDPGDFGDIGRLQADVRELKRWAVGIAAGVFSGLVTLIVDLVARLSR